MTSTPWLSPRRPLRPSALDHVARLIAIVGLLTVTAAPARAVDTEEPADRRNPLRTADEPTQRQALDEAWITFQRSCRPCHGNLGAGDGPFAQFSAQRAADLRRPSRTIASDAVRFARIRDGAASLRDRAWESSMPAFGGELSDERIWGLVLLLERLGQEGTGLDPDAAGSEIYAARCAACHGPGGAGDGPLAAELLPRPRDLLKNAYRFRSTTWGSPPLESDLLGVMAGGLGDTAMGRFTSLGGQRLENVAAHVRSLAPELFATTPATFPASPIPAESILQLATRGRGVYEQARCGDCHGTQGRGDGPSAAALKNAAGDPAIATDLTKRWHYKRGAGAAELFRTFSTGLNGTPMESYADALSGDERWALAHYVDRLAQNRPRFSPAIHAVHAPEAVPVDPAADFWTSLLSTPVLLGPQMETVPYRAQPAIDVVDVAVALEARHLAVRLVWNDARKDTANTDAPGASVAEALARHGAWRLPDRIAVQFPRAVDAAGTLPPPYLGSDARPVVRWTWAADRDGAQVEHAGGPGHVGVEPDAPPVEAAAAYADGQWRVVLRGPRPPMRDDATAIAVHAWDGASGEAGHWHGLSGWITVAPR